MIRMNLEIITCLTKEAIIRTDVLLISIAMNKQIAADNGSHRKLHLYLIIICISWEIISAGFMTRCCYLAPLIWLCSRGRTLLMGYVGDEPHRSVSLCSTSFLLSPFPSILSFYFPIHGRPSFFIISEAAEARSLCDVALFSLLKEGLSCCHVFSTWWRTCDFV